MNEITPPKLIPFDQSKLASGILPIEQTNDATAMRGPTSAFSNRRNDAGPLCKNRACHAVGGTSVARNPAIKNPAAISFHNIIQSITNALATFVHFPSVSECEL